MTPTENKPTWNLNCDFVKSIKAIEDYWRYKCVDLLNLWTKVNDKKNIVLFIFLPNNNNTNFSNRTYNTHIFTIITIVTIIIIIMLWSYPIIIISILLVLESQRKDQVPLGRVWVPTWVPERLLIRGPFQKAGSTNSKLKP